MKSLLFISILFLSSCTGDFNISSIFPIVDNGSIKYTWQVDVQALILDLVNEEYKDNIVFQKALKDASKAQDTSSQNFVTLFGQAYTKQPAPLLARLFSSNSALNINAKTSNKATLEILQKQADDLMSQHLVIIQKRMATFGKKIIELAPIENTDQFVVEVQGANTETEQQITTTGKLEFWEVYQNTTISEFLMELNDSLMIGETLQDSLSFEMDFGPLFELLSPNLPQGYSPSATIGYADSSDIEPIMDLLTGPMAKKILGTKWDSIRFIWDAKSFDSQEGKPILTLYALNTKNQKVSALNHTHVVDNYVTKNPSGNGFAISLKMNEEGTLLWKKMTTANVGKQIAITLDDKVYSAPNVNEPIPNGNLSISGGFQEIQTAKNFCNILSLKNVLPGQLTLVKKAIYSNKD